MSFTNDWAGSNSQPDTTDEFDTDPVEPVSTPAVEPKPAKPAKRAPAAKRTKRGAASAYSKQIVDSVIETLDVIRAWPEGTSDLAAEVIGLAKNARDESALVSALLGSKANEFKSVLDAADELVREDADAFARMGALHSTSDDARNAIWRMLTLADLVSETRPADSFALSMAAAKAVEESDPERIEEFRSQVLELREAVS